MRERLALARDRGEKREIAIFTLLKKLRNLQTFSDPTIPSAYFDAIRDRFYRGPLRIMKLCNDFLKMLPYTTGNNWHLEKRRAPPPSARVRDCSQTCKKKL